MTNVELVTAADAAAILKRPRREVTRLVERGALTPALKLPGIRGAYLFEADAVARLAAKETTP